MKKGLLLTSVVFMLVAASAAQVATEPAPAPSPDSPPSAASPASGASPAGDLAPGTTLSVELSRSLDARKSKANDKIEARIATDVLAHGHIVVPRNTKIVGHVTEAKAHSKASPDSVVGITFDRMLLKDGREVPLQLTVQAIARPLQVASSPSAINAASSDNPAAESPTTMAGQRPTIGDSPLGPSYPTAGDPGLPSGPPASNSSTPSPLGPTTRGVVGITGLSLDTSGPAAVLTSTTGNVHLDSRAQLILRVQ